MSPSRAGLSLMASRRDGATPVLAPGTMSLLGIVGLAFTYRHPAITIGGFQLEGAHGMTRVLGVLVISAVLAGYAHTAYAQVGKPVTIVDANTHPARPTLPNCRD
jgi:hypothetical protein